MPIPSERTLQRTRNRKIGPEMCRTPPSPSLKGVPRVFQAIYNFRPGFHLIVNTILDSCGSNMFRFFKTEKSEFVTKCVGVALVTSLRETRLYSGFREAWYPYSLL